MYSGSPIGNQNIICGDLADYISQSELNYDETRYIGGIQTGIGVSQNHTCIGLANQILDYEEFPPLIRKKLPFACTDKVALFKRLEEAKSMSLRTQN